MTPLFVRLLVVVVILSVSACATLDHGTFDDIPVTSVPPGAFVSSSSGTICTAPCLVAAPRKDAVIITISAPGYVTQTVTTESKPDQAAIDAAASPTVTPDVLGRVIDIQGGSLYRHVPKAFVVKLVPAP